MELQNKEMKKIRLFSLTLKPHGNTFSFLGDIFIPLPFSYQKAGEARTMKLQVFIFIPPQ